MIECLEVEYLFLHQIFQILNYRKKELNEWEYNKVITGQKINNNQFDENEVVLLTKDGSLVSIAKIEDLKIKVIKVFV